MDAVSRKGWIVLIVVFAMAWFGTLDFRRLINPDEGRYAEIAREMAVSGDWVTPRLNDLKYFEKPPLQYWATAAAFKLFGEHHWTARLWAALTGFSGILFTAFAVGRLFGSRAGVLSGVVLASSFLWNAISHINTLDAGVSFFLSAGIFALCLAEREGIGATARQRWRDGAWVFFALAVLSKGLIGLALPAAALLAYLLWQRDWRLPLRIQPFRGILIVLVIAGPWFVAVSLANPEFPRFFFIHEHFERFLTEEHGRYEPAWYFIPVLLGGILPWLGGLAQGLACGLRSEERNFQPARLLLVWSVVVFVFFSASGSKLASYILPIFPTLAALIGIYLSERSKELPSGRLVAPALLAALIVFVGAFFITRRASEAAVAAAYADYRPWLQTAAVVLFAGAVVAFFLYRNRRSLLATLVFAAAGYLSGQLALLGHDAIGKINSAHAAVQAIQSAVPPGVPFYSVGTYDQSFEFYMKRTTTLVAYRGELALGVKAEPGKFIADLADFEAAWHTAPQAWALMKPEMAELLARHGLPMIEVFRDPKRVIVRKPGPLP